MLTLQTLLRIITSFACSPVQQKPVTLRNSNVMQVSAHVHTFDILFFVEVLLFSVT